MCKFIYNGKNVKIYKKNKIAKLDIFNTNCTYHNSAKCTLNFFLHPHPDEIQHAYAHSYPDVTVLVQVKVRLKL